MLYHTTFQIFIKLILLRICINFPFFLSFAGPEEVEGGGRAKQIFNLPGVGHGGYPCKLISGPCDSWGPQS